MAEGLFGEFLIMLFKNLFNLILRRWGRKSESEFEPHYKEHQLSPPFQGWINIAPNKTCLYRMGKIWW
jgi:hypothetical protein